MATERTARGAGPDVLVVCRANRARSPVVAELLRQHAVAHGVQPLPRISSCGLYAEPGLPLLDKMQRALDARHLALPEHSARRFRTDEAERSRLVISFEQAHKRAIVVQLPALVPRTYTLREVARLARSPLWRSDWNGSPDVAAHLHALRPMVEAGEDDTPDPASLPRWRVRRLLDQLVEDVQTVAPVLLAPRADRTGQNDAAWRP